MLCDAVERMHNGGQELQKMALTKQDTLSIDTINNLIDGGTGANKQEPTIRLSLDVPEGVHTQLNLVCTEAGEKITSEVIATIERMTTGMEAKQS